MISAFGVEDTRISKKSKQDSINNEILTGAGLSVAGMIQTGVGERKWATARTARLRRIHGASALAGMGVQAAGLGLVVHGSKRAEDLRSARNNRTRELRAARRQS